MLNTDDLNPNVFARALLHTARNCDSLLAIMLQGGEKKKIAVIYISKNEKRQIKQNKYIVIYIL